MLARGGTRGAVSYQLALWHLAARRLSTPSLEHLVGAGVMIFQPDEQLHRLEQLEAILFYHDFDVASGRVSGIKSQTRPSPPTATVARV